MHSNGSANMVRAVVLDLIEGSRRAVRSVPQSPERDAQGRLFGTRSSVDTAKAIVGLRPSFSAQVRFGEPGAPVDSLLRCYDTDPRWSNAVVSHIPDFL
jgi:hypothetical protein